MCTIGVKAESAFSRFVRDESGQDLIEHALLAVTVGLGVVVSFNFVLSVMGTSYNQSIVNVGNQWQTPNPAGS